MGETFLYLNLVSIFALSLLEAEQGLSVGESDKWQFVALILDIFGSF